MADIKMLDHAIGQIERVEAAAAAEAVARRVALNGQSFDITEQWNQSSWRSVSPDTENHRCQTAMCLAGWVVELDDTVTWRVSPEAYYLAVQSTATAQQTVQTLRKMLREVRADDERYEEWHALCNTAYVMWETLSDKASDMSSQLELVVTPHQEIVTAGSWAADRLGINTYQADQMFHQNNSLRALKNMVGELAADPDADLVDLVTRHDEDDD